MSKIIFILQLVLAFGFFRSATLLFAEDNAARLPVTMIIRVRTDAELFVQGERSKAAGGERRFESPPLAANQDFVYTLKAVWKEDGLDQVFTRQVRVRAGETLVVDLRGDASVPNGKKEKEKEKENGSAAIQRTPAVNSTALSSLELETVRLVNVEREKKGLPPVSPNPKLFVAAREHSRNMALKQELTHTLDGKEFWDRITAAGYTHGPAGENIAEGPTTAAEAITDWMNSPGHRENILKPTYQEIGVGIVRSTSGRNYWTQLFASPREP